jgi:hypothetical protein
VRFLRRILRYTLALALVLVPTAQADRSVIYGVNDGNLASFWPEMAPKLAGLGPIQVGSFVRWRCGVETQDKPPFVLQQMPADLGTIPNSQPILVQFLGAPGCTPRTALQRAAYARAALELVRRNLNIRELQVWNEPNIGFWRGSVKQYVLLLAATYDRLRGTGVKLLGPGFSPNGLGDNPWVDFSITSFADEVARYYTASNRKRPLLDGFSYHPYWGYSRHTTRWVAEVLNRAWAKTAQPTPKRGAEVLVDGDRQGIELARRLLGEAECLADLPVDGRHARRAGPASRIRS